MGHGIILLYLGYEGSRSNGVLGPQSCPNFPTSPKLAPLAEMTAYGIKDSSVTAGSNEVCAGRAQNGGIFDSTGAPRSRPPRFLRMALFSYKGKISQFLATNFKVKVDTM